MPWPTGTAPDQTFCSEDQRLVVLASFETDTLVGDDELAKITRFAAQLCDAPTSLVSIVEQDRQHFIANTGLDASETPRSSSFCAHAMLRGEVMIVNDTSEHETFASNPLVTGAPHIRFYAGTPLISREGAPLGSLCVIDYEPRPEGLTELQLTGLRVLGQAVKRRLESRRHANRTVAEVRAASDRVRMMIDSVPDIAWSASPGAGFDQFNARWRETTGLPEPRTVEEWGESIHPEDFPNSSAKFRDAVARAESFEDTIRLRTKDGTYRWMLSRAVPSTDNPDTARWFGTLTDIDDRYRLSQERELLAGELAHRIKNIFSVINGLVTLHARGKTDVKQYSTELSQSIIALSRAQDFALRIDTSDGENLIELLTILTAPYGAPGSMAITVSGDRVSFGRKAATPLALVFHELATNSAKYGAMSTSEGKIAITVHKVGENVEVVWSESDGPPAEAPTEQGFGSRLIAMAIQSQLGGTLVQDWREDGLHAKITIPSDRLAQ